MTILDPKPGTTLKKRKEKIWKEQLEKGEKISARRRD